MSPLVFVALVQVAAADCHDAPRATRVECARQAVMAAEADLAARGVEDCSEAETTVELNFCAVLDLRREETRMFRYLALAETRAIENDAASVADGEPTRSLAWLAASQASWRAYAEIECDGVHDRWRAGTIRTVMSLDCRIEMTRARTHVLWDHHLTYVDSARPLAPEPVETVAGEARRGR